MIFFIWNCYYDLIFIIKYRKLDFLSYELQFLLYESGFKKWPEPVWSFHINLEWHEYIYLPKEEFWKLEILFKIGRYQEVLSKKWTDPKDVY